jgi:hypothetical protein
MATVVDGQQKEYGEVEVLSRGGIQGDEQGNRVPTAFQPRDLVHEQLRVYSDGALRYTNIQKLREEREREYLCAYQRCSMMTDCEAVL